MPRHDAKRRRWRSPDTIAVRSRFGGGLEHAVVVWVLMDLAYGLYGLDDTGDPDDL